MADPKSLPGTRRHPRAPMDVLVRLIPDPQGARTAYPARMLDASEWGARLATDTRLENNQIIELIPGPTFTSGVLCRVVWVAQIGPERERQTGVNFLGAQSSSLWTQGSGQPAE